MAQHAAQRRCNFSGRERTSGHLVQQRLKKMKIAPVNQRDFDGRALQLLRGSQSAKSAAENDDSMFLVHAPCSPNATSPNLASSHLLCSRGKSHAHSWLRRQIPAPEKHAALSLLGA